MHKIEGAGFLGEVRNFKAYMMRKGIPHNMIEQIRLAFVNEALGEANDMKYDRIYSAIALALRRVYGFGPQRILRLLKEFDRLVGTVATDDYSWEQLMADLDDETGIVIRTDSSNANRLVCEYMGKTYKRANQINDAERRSKEYDGSKLFEEHS